MMIIEPRLFVGFLVDSPLRQCLDEISPQLRDHFINARNSDYLFELSHRDASYLGKFIDNNTGFTALDLIESNILSLLKKIVPNFPCNTNGPFLISTIGD